MSVNVAEVNRLLVASRAAHDMKKRKAGVIDRTGAVIAPPNYQDAEQHLVEALRLRLEAHALDPEHTASGWADDRAKDADLIRFYVRYSRPYLAPEQLALVVARFPDAAEGDPVKNPGWSYIP